MSPTTGNDSGNISVDEALEATRSMRPELPNNLGHPGPNVVQVSSTDKDPYDRERKKRERRARARVEKTNEKILRSGIGTPVKQTPHRGNTPTVCHYGHQTSYYCGGNYDYWNCGTNNAEWQDNYVTPTWSYYDQHRNTPLHQNDDWFR